MSLRIVSGLVWFFSHVEVVATRASISISLEYSSRRTKDIWSSGSLPMSVNTTRRGLPVKSSTWFGDSGCAVAIAAMLINKPMTVTGSVFLSFVFRLFITSLVISLEGLLRPFRRDLAWLLLASARSGGASLGAARHGKFDLLAR